MCEKRATSARARRASTRHLISKIYPAALSSFANSKTVPTKISDLRIAREESLPPPRELHVELPVAETEAAHIDRWRSMVQAILLDKDNRLLVVVGPCSIHEPESALEYAGRLRDCDARHETKGIRPRNSRRQNGGKRDRGESRILDLDLQWP